MTTPPFTTLQAYASLAELAAALQQDRCTVEVQASILVLSELTLNALKDSPAAHIDAVVAECSELIRTLAAAEAATVDA